VGGSKTIINNWNPMPEHFLHKLRSLFLTFGLNKLERFRKPIGFAINGSILLILGLILYKNLDILPQLARVFSFSVFGPAFALYFASLLVQFLIWMDLMGYQRIETSRAIEEYVNTLLMGMLPGGLWKIFGRMTMYRAPRLSANTILMINLVEMLLLLVANATVLLLIIPLGWSLRIVGLLVLLLAVAVLRTRLSPSLPSFQKHRSAGLSISTLLHWWLWIGGYMIAWVCGGAITLLVLSGFGISLSFVQALSYWCVASAAGLVLQAIPINAIIRDATIVALLVQTSLPLPEAIIVAFALRLMMMASEVSISWTSLGIIWLIRRYFCVPSQELHVCDVE
jgi:hypothetical protein